MSKAKWLIYIVLIGLTPIIARFSVYLIASKPASIFNAGDIISFGLILVISNINLLEHQQTVSPSWKTINIGLSLVLAVLFAALFTAICIYDIDANVVNLHKIKIGAGVLTLSALILSYAVVDRLSAQIAAKEVT